jgi:uncharacterized protein GlcG (DUF336 family)
MPALTIAQASTIIDVALQKGREMKFAPLAVAVLDAGGNLVAFKRDDRAGILRFDIAFGKAWGALGMGFGSRTVFERANSTEAQRLFYADRHQSGRHPDPRSLRRGDRHRRHLRRHVRQR